MTYDDYITGLHDDNSPMNRKEELSEIEELHRKYSKELENRDRRIKYQQDNIIYLGRLLKEAGGIFELYRMTGNITEKEINLLSEIFEPYLTK